jgi:hypothetical protein
VAWDIQDVHWPAEENSSAHPAISSFCHQISSLPKNIRGHVYFAGSARAIFFLYKTRNQLLLLRDMHFAGSTRYDVTKKHNDKVFNDKFSSLI